MRRLHLSLSRALFVAIFGCGERPDVARDLATAVPGATLVSADPGEGDASSVYYRVRYRAPGDTSLVTEEWRYQKSADGAWVRRANGPGGFRQP